MMRQRFFQFLRGYGVGLLAIGLLLQSFTGLSPAYAFDIRLNEAGYHPNAPKTVILEGIPAGEAALSGKKLKIYLYDPQKKGKYPFTMGVKVFEVAPAAIRPFTGKASKTGSNNLPNNLKIDVSDYQTPGSYEFKVEGLAEETISVPFKISEFSFWDVLKPAMRSFYFQRCGYDIYDLTTEIYHIPCHTEDALKPSGAGTHVASGGWHDSGMDYNKSLSVHTQVLSKLLALYEESTQPLNFLGLDYPVTESGVGLIPDYLHEVKIGLDWLQDLQRSDGLFYAGVSGVETPDIVIPTEDLGERILSAPDPKTSARAVAVLAMAARAYKQKDLSYAIRCLLAAERGWNGLIGWEREMTLDQQKEFGQKNTDLLWAASELYITTGKDVYHQRFLSQAKSQKPSLGVGEGSPALQGLVDYVLYANTPDNEVKGLIKKMIQTQANQVTAHIKNDPYGVGIDHFGKDSNFRILERAELLLAANRLLAKGKYLEEAAQGTYYIFGLNPLGKTFVTGVGEHPAENPSHNMLRALHKSLPGLLVAGANQDAADGKTPAGKGPLSYSDNMRATDSNGTSLLYNVTLVKVMGELNAAYNAEPGK